MKRLGPLFLFYLFTLLFCVNHSISTNSQENSSKFTGSWIPVRIQITDSTGHIKVDSTLHQSEIKDFILVTKDNRLQKYIFLDSCTKVKTYSTRENGDSLIISGDTIDPRDVFISTGDTITTSFRVFGFYNTIYLCKYNGELPPENWPAFNCANHPCIGNLTCAELEK